MKKTRLPYKVYTIPILLLAAIGLLTSLYLAQSHYRNYTDIGYSSFCAISKAINCDTVSQSPWSLLFGLPLALWGSFAYSLFLIIALSAQSNSKTGRNLWDLLFVLAFIYCLVDVYFAYVAVITIKAYCILCLLTYGVSLGLLFSTWIIRRRFYHHSLTSGILGSFSFIGHHKILSSALVSLLILFGTLKLFLPAYWVYEYPPLSQDIHTGITEEGRHWIGAEHPTLIIQEFTDYQCFQCSKMHLILRHIVNQHPDTVRLVHYHYPMDENFNTVLVKTPFHTGSGPLALLAIAAGRQGKYWQANDGLYAIARQGIKEFNIDKFAGKLQLDSKKLKQDMYSQSALKELEADIRTGLKNKIIGTPSFIVNGEVYTGHLPPAVLDKVAR